MLNTFSSKDRQTTETQSWFWDHLQEFLDKKQLKQTKQRKMIIECFLKMNSHVYAEELHNTLKENGHNVGLATIYRTMALLKSAKLIDEKTFGDGKALFEIIKPNSHHDHLICIDCGRVIEFANDDIEQLQVNVAQRYGFKLASHNLELYGKCISNKTKCKYAQH